MEWWAQPTLQVLMKKIHPTITSVLILLITGCAHVDSAKNKTKAERIVQQQLEAYNARDIDAFLATYSPDIKIYNHPNELRFSNLQEMRDRYSKMLKNTPNLHCEIVNRIVLGNHVFDQEKVTGFPDGRIIEAVAIYKVENGLIHRVWFVKK